MSEEWGPWQEHDGKGCPCVGQYVQLQTRSGMRAEGVAGTSYAVRTNSSQSGWVWPVPLRHALTVETEVETYRIRRPKGMAILEQLLADIPAPVAREVVG